MTIPTHIRPVCSFIHLVNSQSKGEGVITRARRGVPRTHFGLSQTPQWMNVTISIASLYVIPWISAVLRTNVGAYEIKQPKKQNWIVLFLFPFYFTGSDSGNHLRGCLNFHHTFSIRFIHHSLLAMFSLTYGFIAFLLYCLRFYYRLEWSDSNKRLIDWLLV